MRRSMSMTTSDMAMSNCCHLNLLLSKNSSRTMGSMSKSPARHQAKRQLLQLLRSSVLPFSSSVSSCEWHTQGMLPTIPPTGVVVHSVIIGLTLAVTDEFSTLFVVIIFHQTFEGLGLGTRLAQMPLPHRLNWVPLSLE